MPARRIIVVGCQGRGKTSLALRLGRNLGLPVVHLDVLYWRPGWKESDKASFRVRVADAIAGEGWVVDGSFSGALLPLLPHNQVGGGPALYGMLLGAIGTGAVAAAFALPRLTRQCGGPPRFDHSLEEPV